MINSVKNKFVLLILLLVALPVAGQVYTTSKAKVHSVSTSGVGYDTWSNSTIRGNVYGSSSSFYSTSSNVSSGLSYSVSVPSISVKTSFSTSAAAITGGVTLADDLGLDVENNMAGPRKVPGVPEIAPVGDIPWVVLLLACGAFAVVKVRRRIKD